MEILRYSNYRINGSGFSIFTYIKDMFTVHFICLEKRLTHFYDLLHIYDIMLAICESIYHHFRWVLMDPPTWAPHQVGFNRAPALHRVGPPTPGGRDIRGSMQIKVKKRLLIYMGCFLWVLFLNELLTYCFVFVLFFWLVYERLIYVDFMMFMN